MSRLHIIAEAGTNHGGDYAKAVQLAQIAQRAGADSVKYQVIYPEGLYLPKFYQEQGYEDNEVFKQRSKAMLSDEAYVQLRQACEELQIPFSASVFDQRGIDLLVKLNAPYIKIASCDLNNIPLLVKAAETGKKLIISTGMSSLADIDYAVEQIFRTGNHNLVLMHCVSVYPCPTELTNLSFIQTLKTAFGLPVGFSDHTENSVAAAIAVSMGVSWIEKHFTYDRKAEGFDHAYAMEPEAFEGYIHDLRQAERACTFASQKLSEQERVVRSRARRALYAARDLSLGETLTDADLLIVRPEGPLEPKNNTLIVGKVLNKPVKQYQPLKLEDFNF